MFSHFGSGWGGRILKYPVHPITSKPEGGPTLDKEKRKKERQKDRKTERQKERKTERERKKERKKEIQKERLK